MEKKVSHDRFFALLSQMPGADKESLVWQYSGMLTTSLREFHEKNPLEYARMIADLETKVKQSSKYYWSQDKEVKRLRSGILHRLQKHGIDTTDWKTVNLFLTQPRIAGKMLFEMSIDEMRALTAKLEMILAKDRDVKNEENKLSLSN